MHADRSGDGRIVVDKDHLGSIIQHLVSLVPPAAPPVPPTAPPPTAQTIDLAADDELEDEDMGFTDAQMRAFMRRMANAPPTPAPSGRYRLVGKGKLLRARRR